MSDEIYQETLLKLAKEAPGHGRLEPNAASVRLDNPLCGDRVRIDLRVRGGRIAEVAHEVRGCLLCQAAAGVIGRHAVGLDRAGVAELSGQVEKTLAGEIPAIEDLAAFRPVSGHRSRFDCVRLPFQALKEAAEIL
ncbi:MAG: iron-sulfur cluster assembly scaffold protein [Alphaproteobacteria bacterium]|nr:iron-sulfur cluster assembly scaffold protein [Alphaproteobacteria bacterium]